MTSSSAIARTVPGGHSRLRRQPSRPRVWHSCNDLGALVAAAAGGDQKAWETIVARFDRTIRAIARRHRLAETDQDEVVQRVWIRLIRHIDAIRNPAALSGWLATAARNESLRLITSCRDIPVAVLPISATEDDAGPEDEAIAAERCAALHQALDRLPDRQRTLMRMLVAEPARDYDQLSAALDMRKGSIGPTRQRSLARLAHDPQLARVVGHARPRACRDHATRAPRATGDHTP